MGPSAVSAKPALEREAPALPPAKGRPLCVRKTVAALLASALLVGGGGVLVAFLAQREFVVEHVAELWGIPYESSLEHPGSDYSRMLTPVLEGLFRSSFQNSSLEGRCARCSVLQYRRGNASVLVRLHLWFSTEPPSPAQEEEALSRGLVATLGGQGISLATYGTLSSISLAGSFSPSGMARKSGRCPGSAFPCRSGQCVAVQNAECNDRRDCADGSDEAECDCGARPALQASSRIVGGSQASRGEFPWQVSLRENHEHFCGATILSARWLVSAAHCFNEFQDPGSWTAHAGSVWLSGGGEGVGAKAGVARILRHPSYDTDTADYDIALLELAEPLAFSKYVQPVCLPAASHAFPVGRKCLISGWGYLKEDFLIKPELLQKATVELLDQALCTTLYKNALTARMVCAGYLEGKVDSCQGDSGGPLVCEETSGRFFLAGITSWGIGCAEARRPGVYTRVTKLRDWILHTMAAPPAQPGLSRPTLSWPVASTTVVGGKLRPTVATDRPAATMAWPQASKPENLQRASVGILDQKTCNALYNFSLTERMLCAGFLEGQVDSCQGDSGGPLACEETPGVFYLAGLVSWGLGCAQAKRPGVYTRITKLKGWIVDAMASLRPGTVPGSLVGALPASSSTPATSSAPAFSQPSASQGMTWPLLSSSLRAGASLSRMTAGFSRAPLLPGVPCSPSTFKCSSKVCIGKVNPECDGIPDCSNGKDEADCDCGLTPATAFSKIVGGSGAARGEWPWQVSLWLRRKEHKCGAVVIAERWLLSAAHCFDRYSNPKLWVAVLGTPSLSGLDGQVETVARILRHPFYNAYTLDYDMALLELASPLRYSRAVKPICLPDGTHRFPAGSPCFITGWGSTKEGGPTSKHLQKAAVKLLAEADCRRFYPVQISSRMLCAGFPQGAVDSCSGDAGGPLACREPSGRWFLAGITSWGYGCARPFFPGVYAKVTAVRGWIGQNLKE
uniref:Transmembrane protease serine 9 isoform X3 n=1 Tax=Pogona vitticeps TaxID=103695 RepID=A0ABM5EMD4_9SAUR